MTSKYHFPGAIKAFGQATLVLCAYFIIQLTVIRALWNYEAERAGFDPALNEATGFMLSVAILVSAPACLLFTVVLMRPAKGANIRDYLNIRLPGIRAILGWMFIALITGVLYMAASTAIGRPLVNDFMEYIYKTAFSLPLLIVSVGLIGPLFEELLFREYLLRSIAVTKAGAGGAIVLTSLMWAVIHVQYGLFDLSYIFILGLILGVARHQTGSVLTPYMMHALNNILSIVLAMSYTGMGA